LTIVGAPSSAGAYAPGQEKAPAALRAAGLTALLRERGVDVADRGDVVGSRWRADRENPRAMNVATVAQTARALARESAAAWSAGGRLLVLGGDCTVELGTVAGALATDGEVGLVYLDLDTDLNTPASTTDGALDWMGVAHLLGIEGTVPELAEIGPRFPLLRPEQVHFFGHDNVEPCERRIIDRLGIAETRLPEVAADPVAAATRVVTGWGARFARLLVHLDVDVVDYLDLPLAENVRRNRGLRFEQLQAALGVLVGAPNFAGLTVTELNPDHGEADGSTLRRFAEGLAEAVAGRLVSPWPR
jgi:arginase